MSLLPKKNPRNEPRITELNWYARYGKYPDRIAHTSIGKEYMEGDWSWNRRNPDKIEYVERLIKYMEYI